MLAQGAYIVTWCFPYICVWTDSSESNKNTTRAKNYPWWKILYFLWKGCKRDLTTAFSYVWELQQGRNQIVFTTPLESMAWKAKSYRIRWKLGTRGLDSRRSIREEAGQNSLGREAVHIQHGRFERADFFQVVQLGKNTDAFCSVPGPETHH